MVAMVSLLIALLQNFAQASPPVLKSAQQNLIQECSTDVESPSNVMKVCLSSEKGKSVLVISRYLGSGEVEEEKISFSSLIAKGLENFERSPSAVIK